MEQRRITRREARAILVEMCIPKAFREDFTSRIASDSNPGVVWEGFDNLERQVNQASALLFLISNELGRELEDVWDNRGGEAAGIVKLGLDTAAALQRAFIEIRQAVVKQAVESLECGVVQAGRWRAGERKVDRRKIHARTQPCGIVLEPNATVPILRKLPDERAIVEMDFENHLEVRPRWRAGLGISSAISRMGGGANKESKSCSRCKAMAIL